MGGGAAGFMTAITAAENGVKRIIILEGSSKIMEKVRISGGGRCNVTNATWIPNELAENYPEYPYDFGIEREVTVLKNWTRAL